MFEDKHKTLDAILRKRLTAAPRRLQNIMIKLNRYDKTFKSVKREDRRCIQQSNCGSTRLSIKDHKQCMDPDISGVRLEEICKATEKGSELQCLIEFKIHFVD